MEADIVDGKIGAVGSYDFEFKGGALVFEVKAEKIGKASLKVELPAAALIDALAAAIPGKIDDAVFGLIKAALVA